MLLSTIRTNYILSNEELADLDKKTISCYGISSAVLMEEASERIFSRLKKDFNNLHTEKIALICGWGNNGGDTLCIARKLFFENISFDIYVFPDKKGSELFEAHKKTLRSLNITLYDINTFIEKKDDYSLIIDGIFGVGYNYKNDAFIESLFSAINASKAQKASIDIPSGLNRDGYPSVAADYTYSVGFMKKLFFTSRSRSNAGILRDIKISFYDECNSGDKAVYLNKIEKLEIKKSNFVHKYKRGSVLCIGGEPGKFGSIIFASEAAMKTGCGIALVITEKENISFMNKLSKSVIFESYENIEKQIKKYSAIIIGPGLSAADNKKKVIEKILTSDKQFILDASFFTIFDKNILHVFKTPPLLTPHTQEFKSFFKDEAEMIDKEPIDTVINLSKKYNVHILLKDSFMIYSGPEASSFVYDNPRRILAQAGSGDILSGVLAGLISQGYNPYEALLEGIRIFYNAAELLEAKNKSSYSAEDFISLLNN